MKKSEIIDKKKVTDSVIELLSSVQNLKDRLEILANVFMIYGVEIMSEENAKLPERITPEIVVSMVLDDIRQRGNTLGNSLAMQGVTLLEWLSRKV